MAESGADPPPYVPAAVDRVDRFPQNDTEELGLLETVEDSEPTLGAKLHEGHGFESSNALSDTVAGMLVSTSASDRSHRVRINIPVEILLWEKCLDEHKKGTQVLGSSVFT